MEITEIRTTLLSHIDRIGQDADALKRVLEYIESIEPNNKRPSIADDSLSEYIKADSAIIVPFVCDDMFEYVKDGKSLSIGEYLCCKFQEKWNIKDEISKVMKSNIYFGISLYEQDKRGINRAKSIYDAIESGIGNGEITLRECVREFLTKGDFPVIVTTMGFPIIENLLSQRKYESEWYNPNKRNDLPFIRDAHTRVVYHLFGGENSNTWVYNDQSLLKYVHAFHSEDFGPQNLSNYLRGNGNNGVKRPLILGSTLPDWLFRFFVYPLYGDKLSESNGYWMSLDDIEKGLDMFLNRNKYTGQTNLRRGNRVNEILAEATVEHNIKNQEDRKPYKIFISYKRESSDSVNAEIIERIYELLRKQAKATGGDVWRDIEQVADGGNPYWANIKKAIKECNLFIPIVSFPYLDEFQNAPDVSKYADGKIIDAELGDTNDDDVIMALKPVVREAYYALAYDKKCVPIVIANKEGSLNGGTAEAIIRNPKDNRNIPSRIFNEHTNLVHDDNCPMFFNLPQID